MPITLLDAAKRGRLKECVRLLNKGADIEGRGLSQTPLEGAVVMGQVDVVRLLIARGADVHRRCSGIHRPLLTVAAGNGDVEICRILIEKGLRVDEIDERGYTAIHVAACEGRSEVSRLLIDAGAKVDIPCLELKTALHSVIDGRTGDIDTLRALVMGGLRPSHSIDDESEEYLTPAQYAIALDQVEIFRFFVEECGESIDQTTRKGLTAEDLARNRARMPAALLSLRAELSMRGAMAVDQSGEHALERKARFSPL
jgi:ankyrin repeat protein